MDDLSAIPGSSPGTAMVSWTEVGDDWWRSEATGEILRDLFLEGTRPTSEEVAGRLGFEPLDTGPLVEDLSAA